MSDTSKLLTGGNPQIAKGDGDDVVEAYLQAVPGWKYPLARRLDEMVMEIVPDVRKAVRWNQPFYGTDGATWFLSFHCLTRYIKVAFHNGADLCPLPPVTSKQARVRYYHVFEDTGVDAPQFSNWVRQASTLPGAALFKSAE